MICIGSNKVSKQVYLCITWKRDWDSTNFILLGIHFSVKLKNITKLNYDYSVVNQITDSSMENKRILTPIGQDTVKLIVKTLILPTLNHLFFFSHQNVK